MIYGYCRKSTPQQSMERQERNIRQEFPEAHIVKEVFSGRKDYQDRKEFNKMDKQLQ